MSVTTEEATIHGTGRFDIDMNLDRRHSFQAGIDSDSGTRAGLLIQQASGPEKSPALLLCNLL